MTESPDHISCRELVELVTGYLERAVPAGETALVEQHLNFCEGCVWYVEQMRGTVRVAGRIAEDESAPTTATGSWPRSAAGERHDRLQVPAPRRHEPVHRLRLAPARRRARAVARGVRRGVTQRDPRAPPRR